MKKLIALVVLALSLSTSAGISAALACETSSVPKDPCGGPNC